MRSERIILSFIAVLLGLVVAGATFYLYQMSSKPKTPKPKVITLQLSPSPTPPMSDTSDLTVTAPNDESVTDKKTITISGKTKANSTVLIATELGQDVVTASADGSFSDDFILDNGVNFIYVTAIFPDGQEKQVSKTVTYSTEDF